MRIYSTDWSHSDSLVTGQNFNKEGQNFNGEEGGVNAGGNAVSKSDNSNFNEGSNQSNSKSGTGDMVEYDSWLQTGSSMSCTLVSETSGRGVLQMLV